MTGRAAFNREQLVAMKPAILVKEETAPEDMELLHLAGGFLTAKGGATSHAALVARQMGKVAVVGAMFSITADGAHFGEVVITSGQEITLGREGEIFIMGKEAPKTESKAF